MVVTEGVQVNEKPRKDGMAKARDRIKGHADRVIGNMKLQEEMARYFVHRDLEGWGDHSRPVDGETSESWQSAQDSGSKESL